jgi:hypothetical protein
MKNKNIKNIITPDLTLITLPTEFQLARIWEI